VVDALQALADGVMLGATHALLGLGFTLVFGVLHRLNLAIGPTILLGVCVGSQEIAGHVSEGDHLQVRRARDAVVDQDQLDRHTATA
jgi:branched-subunit amino acid ABC-type transport system permease component